MTLEEFIKDHDQILLFDKVSNSYELLMDWEVTAYYKDLLSCQIAESYIVPRIYLIDKDYRII